ncbi:MAG: sulfatase-like hydrolase/transferase [bacterium]
MPIRIDPRQDLSQQQIAKPDLELRRPIVALSLSLLCLHVWYAFAARSERLLVPHFVSWIQDVCLLVLLGVIIHATIRIKQKLSHHNHLPRIIPKAILLLLAVILSSYPSQLAGFLTFPVNVFRVDDQTVKFFFTEYLGLSALLPPLVFMVLALVFYWVLPKNFARKAIRFVALTFIVLGTLSLSHSAPQPFVFSLQNTIQELLLTGERVVLSLTRPLQSATAVAYDSSAFTIIDTCASLRYNHVLMLVLESVNTVSFEKEFLSRHNGYFAQVKNRSTYFNRYYATNLDSYTSLICILTSVMVPYRSYSDPALYEGINNAPNIVKAVRRRGFKTLFISTYEYQPFVPVRDDWDRIIDIHDLPAENRYVSVGTNKMESATEDMAGLSTIVSFMRSNQQTFVLHELVYGHSPDWIMKTGIPQVEYYDRYIQAITHVLDSTGIGDQTLVVVVSDHGSREHSADINNYQVPLLLTGISVPSGVDSSFASHMDLSSIISGALTGSSSIANCSSLFVVGSTEKWVYGQITSDGSFLFIDDERGTVMASSGHLDAPNVHNGFQRLLNGFAAHFQ